MSKYGGNVTQSNHIPGNESTSTEISIPKVSTMETQLTPIIKNNDNGISKSTISTEISTAHCHPCETKSSMSQRKMLYIMKSCGMEETYYHLDSRFKIIIFPGLMMRK